MILLEGVKLFKIKRKALKTARNMRIILIWRIDSLTIRRTLKICKILTQFSCYSEKVNKTAIGKESDARYDCFRW